MRLGEKFKHDFKRHFLTAFLSLVVIEIFNDRFQPIVPTLIALIVGSVFLGLCLFIGECCMVYLLNDAFKGFKRLLSGRHKEDTDR